MPGRTADQVGTLATPADRFGRMFPDLPPFVPAEDRQRTAMIDMGKVGGMVDAKDPLNEGPIRLVTNPELSPNNRDNVLNNMSAGSTFFGQFLDHDMTFDQTSTLGVPTPPEGTTNHRTPSLDLDSVYGGGPAGSPQLYNPDDPAKLRIESGGIFEDLPRQANGTAIISDPRNDENAILSGLQAAMIMFHNAVVDRVRGEGTLPSAVFETARQLVRWHYQFIIINQFLPQFIGQPLVNDILNNGRKWYRPDPGPAFIPVEFQGAAYRFGHSMVRPSYRLNRTGNADGSAFFGFIFDPSGEGQADPVDLRGGRRAPRRFVGWETFFDFGGEMTQHARPNKRIDRSISTPLFRLPLGAIGAGAQPPISLVQRNLLRQMTWNIPAGQLIAQRMGNPMLHLTELSPYGVALENQTPFFFYVLAEAEDLMDGLHLGPTGGRVVGEVFIGLLELDPGSYLSVNPNWRPTLPSASPGNFRIQDLLTFARVDPFTRGR